MLYLLEISFLGFTTIEENFKESQISENLANKIRAKSKTKNRRKLKVEELIKIIALE